MNGLLKRFFAPFLKRVYSYKTGKRSSFSYMGINIVIFPGVFHPLLTFSTKNIIRFLAGKDLKNLSVLELGAGNGLISLYCSKRGAKVTASDISKPAISGLKLNSKNLGLPVHIISSDLFESIEKQDWDLILINPPYYPKNPTTELERAMFCGEEFEYFERLFEQLVPVLPLAESCLMILSEDCNINRISEKAESQGLKLSFEQEYKNWWEINYIFKIERTLL